MSESSVAIRIEQAIHRYIEACNDGDAERIAACFGSNAVHYFPTVAKWSGAFTIGANFSKRVQALGHFWTVDNVVVDADRHARVLEWTQFDKEGRILRGIDWFVFEVGLVPNSGNSRLRRGANPTRPGAPGVAGFRLCRTRLSDGLP
jgi:hypothetical protein